jgi:hypothetical protein
MATLVSMSVVTAEKPGLDELIAGRDGVLATWMALACLTADELRWLVSSGRWQRPSKGVIVTHSGPLTDLQALRVALLHCGPRAVLGGLTAARLDGLTGFDDKPPISEGTIHVLAPPGRRRRPGPSGLIVAVHYSQFLTDLDVHPAREPRRTRIARSLVDAAAWRATDRGAMAVLAAGVQQRLVRVDQLRDVLGRMKCVRRHRIMQEVLDDIEGGAQALSELDFTRRVIQQFGLPEPSRQSGRRDSRSRRRWIDVLFDKWKVAVEIDGAQHITPLEQWDDMERDNDLNADGYRVLRFPGWLVRRKPEIVARTILQALRANGYPERKRSLTKPGL